MRDTTTTTYFGSNSFHVANNTAKNNDKDHLRNVRHSSATRRSTFPYIKFDAAQRRRNRLIRVPTSHVSVWRDPRTSNIDNLFYREEDILLSLQLLAYLSKYPHIRNVFHSAYEMNVFSLVERFCHWLHAQPVQYWAGVIMRNACRKDETQGGIRRCANMHCGKWEKQQREFAKCRRCRKAKYCSKACQSRAWAEGHRWWCVERPETSASATSTSSSSNNTNSTTAVTGIAGITQHGNPMMTMRAAGAVNNTINNNTATPNHHRHHHHHHHHHHGTTTAQDNNGSETGEQQQQQQQSPAMMNTTSEVVTEDDTVQAMVDAATRTIL